MRRYPCNHHGCSLFEACPQDRRMEVFECSELSDAGEQQFYALCDISGHTVINLTADDVGAVKARRTKADYVAGARMRVGRFLTDRSYSTLVDILHTRENGYAINEDDYAGIRSDGTRKVIKTLLMAVGKGVNGKGWVKSKEGWSQLFMTVPTRRFKHDQIQVDSPFEDKKYYWRIIPDSEFDVISCKGKRRPKTQLTFGRKAK